MQIQNKLFPYPVLTNDLDDYLNNKLDVNIDYKEIKGSIQFYYNIVLENSMIKKAIRLSDIKMFIHVECSSTNYRKIFHCDNYDGTFEIQLSKLNKAIDLCFMLVANKKLDIGLHYGLNKDYKGLKFEIGKGQIVGYFNIGKVTVSKSENEMFKPKSIITVVKKIKASNSLDINLDDDCIKVILSEETHSKFCALQNDQNLSILHSMVVFPCLVYALERMRDSEDMYNDKKWFISIKNHLKKLGIDLNDVSNSTVLMAQKILKDPVTRGLLQLSSSQEE